MEDLEGRGPREGPPGWGGYPGDPGELSTRSVESWGTKLSRRQAAEKMSEIVEEAKGTNAEGVQKERKRQQCTRFSIPRIPTLRFLLVPQDS